MKKLISFLAAASIAGVIGCDSMNPQQMMGTDQFSQFMDPAQMMESYQMINGMAKSEIDKEEEYVKSKIEENWAYRDI